MLLLILGVNTVDGAANGKWSMANVSEDWVRCEMEILPGSAILGD